jgi:hypothetical protein
MVAQGLGERRFRLGEGSGGQQAEAPHHRQAGAEHGAIPRQRPSEQDQDEIPERPRLGRVVEPRADAIPPIEPDAAAIHQHAIERYRAGMDPTAQGQIRQRLTGAR